MPKEEQSPKEYTNSGHLMKSIEKIFLDILKDEGKDTEIRGKLLPLGSSDWDELSLIAERNGLFAIFYTRLLKIRPGNLPAGLLFSLREKYFLNLKRNKLLEEELFRVISYFQGHAIKVVPLKGPVLASHLYKDLGLRQASCDLDILVKPEQLDAAEKSLCECGYTISNHKEDDLLRNYNLKYAKQLVFHRRLTSSEFYMIELHTDIRGEFVPTPLKYFWESLQEMTLGENKILIPSNEELLGYLCLAAMPITEFTELRYIYDIHTLISRHNIDWYLFGKRLDNAQYKDAVFFALRTSRNLFNSAVPKDILNTIRPNLAKRALLNFWINENNVLRRKGIPGPAWYYFFTTWHYFASSYLYARHILDCIRTVHKKIFLSPHEMVFLYKNPPKKPIYSLYIKRLLKPLAYLIKSGKRNTGLAASHGVQRERKSTSGGRKSGSCQKLSKK